MMKSPLFRSAIVGLLLTSSMLLSSRLLEKDLSDVSHLAAGRLGHAVSSLLEKARRSKDELAMQEIIQSLASSPGVRFAAVVNKEENAIAHSRLSQLGKPFRWYSGRDVWSFTLRDDEAQWGKLVFSLSSARENALKAHQRFLGLGASVFLWLIWIVGSWISERRVLACQTIMAERDALLREERAKLKLCEERWIQLQAASASWVQSAVERIPHSCMVLDQRQRVVAINSPAAHLLGAKTPADLFGKSWYDLPQAELCGGALECLNPPSKQ